MGLAAFAAEPNCPHLCASNTYMHIPALVYPRKAPSHASSHLPMIVISGCCSYTDEAGEMRSRIRRSPEDCGMRAEQYRTGRWKSGGGGSKGHIFTTPSDRVGRQGDMVQVGTGLMVDGIQP